MDTREKGFVSAETVARLAGVSRSAVSRTFTDGASVSEATRKKVLEAADALGYHVNHLARGLSHERSNIVGIVVSEIPTPYQARLLDEMTRQLQAIGKIGMVINTTGDAASVANALRQTLNFRADGVIVLSGAPDASLIAASVANGQRVILINRSDLIEGPANLAVENAETAREAYHLLRRAGCQRLAVVSSTAGTPSLTARESAFLDAARADGLTLPVVKAGPTGYAAGAEAARQLYSRSGGPDGVFCVTDLLALGFMDAARHAFSLRVPQDVSIIGFDDIEQAGWESYALTTFRQPVEEMVDAIVQLLAQTGPTTWPHAVPPIKPIPIWRKSVLPRPEAG